VVSSELASARSSVSRACCRSGEIRYGIIDNRRMLIREDIRVADASVTFTDVLSLDARRIFGEFVRRLFFEDRYAIDTN